MMNNGISALLARKYLNLQTITEAAAASGSSIA
jgi:hypothetical protein